MLSNRNFPGKENIVISVDRATREASRIAQLLVKLVTNVVERTTSKMYAKLISLVPGRGSDRDRSCRTKGNCTHKCDIHEVECCDDSPKICSNNGKTDAMNDLTEQVQSLFYH